MESRRVLVIGAGLMGSGIAQVAAAAGHRVTLRDVSQDAVGKAVTNIAWSLGKFVEKGQITAEAREAALQTRHHTVAGCCRRIRLRH